METWRRLAGWLRGGQVCIRFVLLPNHLGYYFQPRNVGKKAGGDLRMSAKYLILVGRELLAAVGLFEKLGGQHDTAHQTQHRGQLVLPCIPKPHSLGEAENDIPDRM